MFQLNYNYKSVFVMSNTFQKTFQDASSYTSSSFPAPALPPPSTTDQEIKIIQDITYSSKNLLHAGHRYSKDDKLLTDGRHSWRCASTVYTIHETFHCLGKSHNHPLDAADSNAKQAIDKVKLMASTSKATNHRIYCAVTGTLPPATMSGLPGEDAVKKIAQRARRKMNPRPRTPVFLAGLVLDVCYP